jgi:hypothetical protein
MLFGGRRRSGSAQRSGRRALATANFSPRRPSTAPPTHRLLLCQFVKLFATLRSPLSTASHLALRSRVLSARPGSVAIVDTPVRSGRSSSLPVSKQAPPPLSPPASDASVRALSAFRKQPRGEPLVGSSRALHDEPAPLGRNDGRVRSSLLHTAGREDGKPTEEMGYIAFTAACRPTDSGLGEVSRMGG